MRVCDTVCVCVCDSVYVNLMSLTGRGADRRDPHRRHRDAILQQTLHRRVAGREDGNRGEWSSMGGSGAGGSQERGVGICCILTQHLSVCARE